MFKLSIARKDFNIQNQNSCIFSITAIIIAFVHRSKDVDWMPYFTQRLVDDFASHIRLYMRALEKAKVANKDGNIILYFNFIVI